MARIQVLELPMQHVGSVSTTPFVLVIDQAEPGMWNHGVVEFGREAGAVSVLVTEHALDVA
jgi:hypothetical protein